MVSYLPMTLYLKDLQKKLGVLGVPIFFKLPKPEVLEPFIVIGANTSDSSRTAQTGVLIEDVTVSIDIFIAKTSRVEAEEMKSKALRALGRVRATANILLDDSVGREVYHVSITVSDSIC